MTNREKGRERDRVYSEMDSLHTIDVQYERERERERESFQVPVFTPKGISSMYVQHYNLCSVTSYSDIYI